MSKTPALPSFKRLNHKTYLYNPSNNDDATTIQQDASAPALILVASWMDANLRHISKFTSHYQSLHPSSPILLLTSSTSDFFFNTQKRQQKELAPAVSTIQSYITDPTKGLLIHALSNGGGGHVALLAEQYRNVTGQPLPAHAMLYDSLPGRSRFRLGVRTMSHGLPKAWYLRWPMQAVIAVLLALFFALPQALGWKTLASVMRDNLNSVDPEFVRKEASRCYIYSDADEFILDHDIEDHAAEGEAKGLRVERARFVGSPHVGHMRVDPDRYWQLVKQTWDRRG